MSQSSLPPQETTAERSAAPRENPQAAWGEGPPPTPGEDRPPATGDDPQRLIQRVGVVVGIITGVLSVLLTVGFVLLPMSTGTEKICVITSSLAFSVAFVSGIGAWPSGRRFAVTATLTGLGVVFLAALSVATQAATTQVPQSAATPPSGSQGGAQPTTRPSTTAPSSTATATPTPTLSPGQSSTSGTRQAGSQSLIDMTPVGGKSGFASGPQRVDSQPYQQTLHDTWDGGYECNGAYGPDTTTYELNDKYRQFHVVVGLADMSLADDMMQFSVLVDNQQNRYAVTLGLGRTQAITVNVTGVFTITLEDSCTGPSSLTGGDVTAVWINPVVSH